MQSWNWNKSFYKFHASGNDFIIVLDKESLIDFEEMEINRICHRKFGVGADGFIILRQQSLSIYRMQYFNRDGKRASFCGNALRCLALCIPMHFAGSFDNDIETDAGICRVSCNSNYTQTRVELQLPVTISMPQKLFLSDKFLSFHKVHFGVPHAVFFVRNLHTFPVNRFGAAIRHHRIFSPDGVNVNFVESRSRKFWVRTYERGVEQETLACGSGGAAVSIVLFISKNIANPIPIVVASKEEVSYSVHPQEATYKVIMNGPASFVFQGMLL